MSKILYDDKKRDKINILYILRDKWRESKSGRERFKCQIDCVIGD